MYLIWPQIHESVVMNSVQKIQMQIHSLQIRPLISDEIVKILLHTSLMNLAMVWLCKFSWWDITKSFQNILKLHWPDFVAVDIHGSRIVLGDSNIRSSTQIRCAATSISVAWISNGAKKEYLEWLCHQFVLMALEHCISGISTRILALQREQPDSNFLCFCLNFAVRWQAIVNFPYQLVFYVMSLVRRIVFTISSFSQRNGRPMRTQQLEFVAMMVLCYSIWSIKMLLGVGTPVCRVSLTFILLFNSKIPYIFSFLNDLLFK